MPPRRQVPPYLDLNLTSVGGATTVGSDIIQNHSETFSITSGIGDTGTNYLSGSLIDVAFGAGSAFTLNASTPPSGDVRFTSGVITTLSDPLPGQSPGF